MFLFLAILLNWGRQGLATIQQAYIGKGYFLKLYRNHLSFPSGKHSKANKTNTPANKIRTEALGSISVIIYIQEASLLRRSQ